MNIIKKVILSFLLTTSILFGNEIQNTLIVENPTREISTIHSNLNKLNSEMSITIQKINLEEIQGKINEGYVEIEITKLKENEDIFVIKDLNDLSKKQRSSIKNFLLRKNIEEKDRIIILDKELLNPYVVKYDKKSNEVLQAYSIKVNRTTVVPTEATITITNEVELFYNPKAIYINKSLTPFDPQYFRYINGIGVSPDLSMWNALWSGGSSTIELASKPGEIIQLIKSGDTYSTSVPLDIGPNFKGNFMIRGNVGYGYVFGVGAGFNWNQKEVNETLIFKGYDSTGKLLTEAQITLKIPAALLPKKILNINVSPLTQITNNILVTDPVGVYPGYSVNLSASGSFPNLAYWNQSLRQTIQIGNQSEIDLKINGDSMESDGVIEIGPNLKSVFAIRKKKSYPALVGFRYEWHWNQKEVNEILIYRQYNHLNEVVAESQINLYIPGYIENKTKTGIEITDNLQLLSNPKALYIGANLKPFDPQYFQYLKGTGEFPNLYWYKQMTKGTLELVSKPGEIIDMTGGITESFSSSIKNIGPNFTGSFIIRGNVGYGAGLGFSAGFTWNQKEVDETLIFRGYNSSGELLTTAEINLKIPAYIPEITNQSFRVLDATSMLTPNSKGKIMIGTLNSETVGESVPTEILGESFNYNILNSISKAKLINKDQELEISGVTSWPLGSQYKGILSKDLNINGLVSQLNLFTSKDKGSFIYFDVKGWNGEAIDEVLKIELLNDKNDIIAKYNIRIIVPKYTPPKSEIKYTILNGESLLEKNSKGYTLIGTFSDLALFNSMWVGSSIPLKAEGNFFNSAILTKASKIKIKNNNLEIGTYNKIGWKFDKDYKGITTNEIKLKTLSLEINLYNAYSRFTPFIYFDIKKWDGKGINEIIEFQMLDQYDKILEIFKVELIIPEVINFELISGNDSLNFGDVAQNTTKKGEALIKIKNIGNRNIKTTIKTNKGLISSDTSIVLPIENLEISNNTTSNNVTNFILSGEISPKLQHNSGEYTGIIEVDITID